MNARRPLAAAAVLAFLLGREVLVRNADAAPPSPVASAGSGASAVADLDKLVDALGDADPSVRRAAAERVVAIGAAGVSPAARVLEGFRKTGVDPGVAALVRSVGNVTSADGGDDAFVVLVLAAPASGVSAKTTLATACLIAALARVGSTDAVRELTRVAHDQGGVFRPELSRQVRRLGERATAALILASHEPQRDVARWASGELEAIGKKVPGDAVQTKSNEVLSDVLGAYGATRDMDALSAVLSFTNSDRAPIREAARRAVVAYGDLALPKLREAFANLAGAPPPQNWTAADVTRELFKKDDRIRLEDVYGLMEAGLSAQAAGRSGEAVADFQKVLSRQPLFERKAEMVPAFVAEAQAREASDRPAALGLYRTALRLAPDGPRAAQVSSALDYLEARSLEERGIVDEKLFRKAAEEDPGNVPAHEEVSRLEAERARRQLRLYRYGEGVLALFLGALGLALWATRRASRKRPRPARP